MVAAEIAFPKPVGTPQLFLTARKVRLLDAHVPDKVLLTVKRAERSCWSDGAYASDGPWRMSIVGDKVRVQYVDRFLTNHWVVDMLPEDTAATATVALGAGGYHANPDHAFMTAASFVLLLILSALVVGYIPDAERAGTILSFAFKSDLKQCQGNRCIYQKPEEPEDELPPQTLLPGTEMRHDEFCTFDGRRLTHTNCHVVIHGDNNGDRLVVHKSESPSIKCVLSMQHDGNLVLYHPEKGAVWASRDAIGKLCPKGVTIPRNTMKLACQH